MTFYKSPEFIGLKENTNILTEEADTKEKEQIVK